MLSASDAPWKIAYFHHPPYSSGEHGSTPRMQWPFADWGVDMCWAPAGWSADGIAWRKDRWSPWSAAPSYADLWDGARTAFGPARGMLLGAGLHLEHTGALAPGSLWAAHGDDAAAADVWSKIESWCAPRTARIRASSWVVV